MKRLYIAVALLAAVTALCVLSHRYQHRQIDRMLTQLDGIEALYRSGDTAAATQAAQDFSVEYRRVSDWISCYVAHGELRESRETAALLATLIGDDDADELYMEIARLREQLRYLRQVDDPLLRNIL